jgi:hypothetical protein
MAGFAAAHAAIQEYAQQHPVLAGHGNYLHGGGASGW